MTRIYAEQVSSEDAIKAYKPIVTCGDGHTVLAETWPGYRMSHNGFEVQPSRKHRYGGRLLILLSVRSWLGV